MKIRMNVSASEEERTGHRRVMCFKMKEGDVCDVFDVVFKEEGCIKDDTKVTDVCGSRKQR